MVAQPLKTSTIRSVPSLTTQLACSWPPETWRDLTVLVAVSGGADSVALLRGLCEVRQAGSGRLVAGHFNHRLRGDESSQDEAFVRELCQKLGVQCRVDRRSGGHLVATPDGLEAAAREDRYQFLEAAAKECGARCVVTAHTANDQAETILHRVIRGTGIRGLGGIPRLRELAAGISLLRPMLSVFRADVVAYLATLNQEFREDLSNKSLEITRNRIRHHLLPLLADEFNPRVAEAIIRLGQLAAEQETAIDQLIGPLIETCCQLRNSKELKIDRASLRAIRASLVPPLLIRLWSEQGWSQRSMDREKWTELAELVTGDGSTAAMTLPGPVRAQVDGETVTIRML